MVKAVSTDDIPQPKANPTTEDLSRQVEALKADITRLTSTMADYGKARGREFRGEAERRATELKGEAQHKVDEIEAYVRTNPAQALGIAAGVGLLIGLLSRR